MAACKGDHRNLGCCGALGLVYNIRSYSRIYYNILDDILQYTIIYKNIQQYIVRSLSGKYRLERVQGCRTTLGACVVRGT